MERVLPTKDLITQTLKNTAENPIDNIQLSALEINHKIGSGGSKDVYDCILDGKQYAIAFPNTIDDKQTISKKWRKALFVESYFTKKLLFQINCFNFFSRLLFFHYSRP